MNIIELVHTNSLGCEIGRYEVKRDSCGYPLTLATVANNVDLRSALDTLEPGDTLAMVERWAERD
jgi:hypothetical protein